MKLAILQYAPVFGDIEGNIAKVERMLSKTEADIFVLPELFATGYVFENKEELLELSEPFPGGRTHEAIKRIARESNSAIIAGFPERAEDVIYNSAMFVKPNGETHLYRKIHLFDREKLLFEPGDRLFEVHEFRGARIGTMICFDWIFPESYRVLALKGADIICHISNLVLPYCQRATYAHAVSNRVFIALSNRIGQENRAGKECRFTGKSVIYSPSGEILAELGGYEEKLAVAEIEPHEARNKMVTEHNDVIQDRRPRFYELS